MMIGKLLEQPKDRFALINGRVITPQEVATGRAVIVEGGKILGIDHVDSLASEVEKIDVGGRYIAPGLIDIHTHGAVGHTFNEPTEEAFAAITAEYVKRGVTSMLATVATAPMPDLVRCLEFSRQWMGQPREGTLSEIPGQQLLDALLDYLRKKELLLLLDSCEHFIDPCASLIELILKNGPQVHILVTSREALGIPGETTFFVPSLSLPDPESTHDPGMMPRSESVRMFVDRAAQAMPGFALSAENAAAIAQICMKLDGIPLALELAAIRVKHLQVRKNADHLDDALSLLICGGRTALPRQKSLYATIDWSYNLLSGFACLETFDHELQTYRRLASAKRAHDQHDVVLRQTSLKHLVQSVYSSLDPSHSHAITLLSRC